MLDNVVCVNCSDFAELHHENATYPDNCRNWLCNRGDCPFECCQCGAVEETNDHVSFTDGNKTESRHVCKECAVEMFGADEDEMDAEGED